MARDKHSNPRTLERSVGPSRRRVYLLWHTDQFGDEKLIGVYERKSDASAAIERIKFKPGFSEEGGTFEIACYRLNKDHWTAGFSRREGSSLPHWFRPGGSN
jgi:hypothetical protein